MLPLLSCVSCFRYTAGGGESDGGEESDEEVVNDVSGGEAEDDGMTLIGHFGAKCHPDVLGWLTSDSGSDHVSVPDSASLFGGFVGEGVY